MFVLIYFPFDRDPHKIYDKPEGTDGLSSEDEDPYSKIEEALGMRVCCVLCVLGRMCGGWPNIFVFLLRVCVCSLLVGPDSKPAVPSRSEISLVQPPSFSPSKRTFLASLV